MMPRVAVTGFFGKFLLGATVSVAATVELANIDQTTTLDNIPVTLGVAAVCVLAIISFVYWATNEHAAVKNDIKTATERAAQAERRLDRQSGDIAGIQRIINELKSSQETYLAAHAEHHRQIADTLEELKNLARNRRNG